MNLLTKLLEIEQALANTLSYKYWKILKQTAPAMLLVCYEVQRPHGL